MSLPPSDVAAALKAVTDSRRILVVCHANVDPDALSSALACYQVFSGMGKEVTVICADTPPASLEFLPGLKEVRQDVAESQNFIITVNLDEGVEIDKLRYTVEDGRVNIIVVPRKGRLKQGAVAFGEGEKSYDLIVVVDTADLTLLGSVYRDHVDLFSEIPVLNIDHHVSNTRYGQIHLIDPASASATEVLYQWFMQVPQFRERITPDLATLLLTGLITDTRSFQNPNTTPRSLEIAAELLEHGARQQEIIQHIYKTKPLSTLRIWGRALNRIQMDKQAGIVWSAVSREDLDEMGAEPQETHGILDELISTVPDADAHVLFTETEPGSLKASMRTSAGFDASRLAGEAFGGGGHTRAAGFRVRGYGNFQLQVLQCVQAVKDGLERQRREQGIEPGARPQDAESSPVMPASTSSKSPDTVVPGSETDVVGELMKRNGGK